MSAPDADPSAALHQLVLQSLDDDQALETVTIPLAGKTSIADHMVIASGRSTRQVASMATKHTDKIKADTGTIPRISGLHNAEWVMHAAGHTLARTCHPRL